MTLPWQEPRVIQHSLRLLRSYTQWTGRELLPGMSAAEPRVQAYALFEAPFIVVSHGTEPDPILNYGNAAALEVWEMSWERLTQTPSRQTAEAPLRDERTRFLERVTRQGVVNHYEGIRIASSGQRFLIEDTTIWNVLDESGAVCGQAAMFAKWRPVK